MQLEHAFIVPATPEQTFDALRDVAGMGPLLPGATIGEVEGSEVHGKLTVKFGSSQITYRGSATVTAADAASHAVTIELAGREARGSGTAQGTILLGCSADEAGTRVHLLTELIVTGRAEGVEPTVLAATADRLVRRFAQGIGANLADTAAVDPVGDAEPGSDLAAAIPSAASVEELTESTMAPFATVSRRHAPAPPHRAEAGHGPVPLGPPMSRRATPLVAVFAVLALVLWLMRRS